MNRCIVGGGGVVDVGTRFGNVCNKNDNEGTKPDYKHENPNLVPSSANYHHRHQHTNFSSCSRCFCVVAIVVFITVDQLK